MGADSSVQTRLCAYQRSYGAASLAASLTVTQLHCVAANVYVSLAVTTTVHGDHASSAVMGCVE